MLACFFATFSYTPATAHQPIRPCAPKCTVPNATSLDDPSGHLVYRSLAPLSGSQADQSNGPDARLHPSCPSLLRRMLDRVPCNLLHDESLITMAQDPYLLRRPSLLPQNEASITPRNQGITLCCTPRHRMALSISSKFIGNGDCATTCTSYEYIFYYIVSQLFIGLDHRGKTVLLYDAL